MTLNETAKLLYLIQQTYIVQYQNVKQESLEAQAKTWTAILTDVDYKEAELALKLYAAHDKGFPPSPGQIIEKVNEIKRKKELAKTLIDMGLEKDIEFNCGADFVKICGIPRITG